MLNIKYPNTVFFFQGEYETYKREKWFKILNFVWVKCYKTNSDVVIYVLFDCSIA